MELTPEKIAYESGIIEQSKAFQELISMIREYGEQQREKERHEIFIIVNAQFEAFKVELKEIENGTNKRT